MSAAPGGTGAASSAPKSFFKPLAGVAAAAAASSSSKAKSDQANINPDGPEGAKTANSSSTSTSAEAPKSSTAFVPQSRSNSTSGGAAVSAAVAGKYASLLNSDILRLWDECALDNPTLLALLEERVPVLVLSLHFFESPTAASKKSFDEIPNKPPAPWPRFIESFAALVSLDERQVLRLAQTYLATQPAGTLPGGTVATLIPATALNVASYGLSGAVTGESPAACASTALTLLKLYFAERAAVLRLAQRIITAAHSPLDPRYDVATSIFSQLKTRGYTERLVDLCTNAFLADPNTFVPRRVASNSDFVKSTHSSGAELLACHRADQHVLELVLIVENILLLNFLKPTTPKCGANFMTLAAVFQANSLGLAPSLISKLSPKGKLLAERLSHLCALTLVELMRLEELTQVMDLAVEMEQYQVLVNQQSRAMKLRQRRDSLQAASQTQYGSSGSHSPLDLENVPMADDDDRTSWDGQNMPTPKSLTTEEGQRLESVKAQFAHAASRVLSMPLADFANIQYLDETYFRLEWTQTLSHGILLLAWAIHLSLVFAIEEISTNNPGKRDAERVVVAGRLTRALQLFPLGTLTDIVLAAKDRAQKLELSPGTRIATEILSTFKASVLPKGHTSASHSDRNSALNSGSMSTTSGEAATSNGVVSYEDERTNLTVFNCTSRIIAGIVQALLVSPCLEALRSDLNRIHIAALFPLVAALPPSSFSTESVPSVLRALQDAERQKLAYGGLRALPVPPSQGASAKARLSTNCAFGLLVKDSMKLLPMAPLVEDSNRGPLVERYFTRRFTGRFNRLFVLLLNASIPGLKRPVCSLLAYSHIAPLGPSAHALQMMPQHSLLVPNAGYSPAGLFSHFVSVLQKDMSETQKRRVLEQCLLRFVMPIASDANISAPLQSLSTSLSQAAFTPGFALQAAALSILTRMLNQAYPRLTKPNTSSKDTMSSQPVRQAVVSTQPPAGRLTTNLTNLLLSVYASLMLDASAGTNTKTSLGYNLLSSRNFPTPLLAALAGAQNVPDALKPDQDSGDSASSGSGNPDLVSSSSSSMNDSVNRAKDAASSIFAFLKSIPSYCSLIPPSEYLEPVDRNRTMAQAEDNLDQYAQLRADWTYELGGVVIPGKTVGEGIQASEDHLYPSPRAKAAAEQAAQQVAGSASGQGSTSRTDVLVRWQIEWSAWPLLLLDAQDIIQAALEQGTKLEVSELDSLAATFQLVASMLQANPELYLELVSHLERCATSTYTPDATSDAEKLNELSPATLLNASLRQTQAREATEVALRMGSKQEIDTLTLTQGGVLDVQASDIIEHVFETVQDSLPNVQRRIGRPKLQYLKRNGKHTLDLVDAAVRCIRAVVAFLTSYQDRPHDDTMRKKLSPDCDSVNPENGPRRSPTDVTLKTALEASSLSFETPMLKNLFPASAASVSAITTLTALAATQSGSLLLLKDLGAVTGVGSTAAHDTTEHITRLFEAIGNASTAVSPIPSLAAVFSAALAATSATAAATKIAASRQEGAHGPAGRIAASNVEGIESNTDFGQGLYGVQDTQYSHLGLGPIESRVESAAEIAARAAEVVAAVLAPSHIRSIGLRILAACFDIIRVAARFDPLHVSSALGTHFIFDGLTSAVPLVGGIVDSKGSQVEMTSTVPRASGHAVAAAAAAAAATMQVTPAGTRGFFSSMSALRVLLEEPCGYLPVTSSIVRLLHTLLTEQTIAYDLATRSALEDAQSATLVLTQPSLLEQQQKSLTTLEFTPDSKTLGTITIHTTKPLVSAVTTASTSMQGSETDSALSAHARLISSAVTNSPEQRPSWNKLPPLYEQYKLLSDRTESTGTSRAPRLMARDSSLVPKPVLRLKDQLAAVRFLTQDLLTHIDNWSGVQAIERRRVTIMILDTILCILCRPNPIAADLAVAAKTHNDKLTAAERDAIASLIQVPAAVRQYTFNLFLTDRILQHSLLRRLASVLLAGAASGHVETAASQAASSQAELKDGPLLSMQAGEDGSELAVLDRQFAMTTMNLLQVLLCLELSARPSTPAQLEHAAALRRRTEGDMAQQKFADLTSVINAQSQSAGDQLTLPASGQPNDWKLSENLDETDLGLTANSSFSADWVGSTSTPLLTAIRILDLNASAVTDFAADGAQKPALSAVSPATTLDTALGIATVSALRSGSTNKDSRLLFDARGRFTGAEGITLPTALLICLLRGPSAPSPEFAHRILSLLTLLAKPRPAGAGVKEQKEQQQRQRMAEQQLYAHFSYHTPQGQSKGPDSNNSTVSRSNFDNPAPPHEYGFASLLSTPAAGRLGALLAEILHRSSTPLTLKLAALTFIATVVAQQPLLALTLLDPNPLPIRGSSQSSAGSSQSNSQASNAPVLLTVLLNILRDGAQLPSVDEVLRQASVSTPTASLSDGPSAEAIVRDRCSDLEIDPDGSTKFGASPSSVVVVTNMEAPAVVNHIYQVALYALTLHILTHFWGAGTVSAPLSTYHRDKPTQTTGVSGPQAGHSDRAGTDPGQVKPVSSQLALEGEIARARCFAEIRAAVLKAPLFWTHVTAALVTTDGFGQPDKVSQKAPIFVHGVSHLESVPGSLESEILTDLRGKLHVIRLQAARSAFCLITQQLMMRPSPTDSPNGIASPAEASQVPPELKERLQALVSSGMHGEWLRVFTQLWLPAEPLSAAVVSYAKALGLNLPAFYVTTQPVFATTAAPALVSNTGAAAPKGEVNRIAAFMPSRSADAAVIGSPVINEDALWSYLERDLREYASALDASRNAAVASVHAVISQQADEMKRWKERARRAALQRCARRARRVARRRRLLLLYRTASQGVSDHASALDQIPTLSAIDSLQLQDLPQPNEDELSDSEESFDSISPEERARVQAEFDRIRLSVDEEPLAETNDFEVRLTVQGEVEDLTAHPVATSKQQFSLAEILTGKASVEFADVLASRQAALRSGAWLSGSWIVDAQDLVFAELSDADLVSPSISSLWAVPTNATKPSAMSNRKTTASESNQRHQDRSSSPMSLSRSYSDRHDAGVKAQSTASFDSFSSNESKILPPLFSQPFTPHPSLNLGTGDHMTTLEGRSNANAGRGRSLHGSFEGVEPMATVSTRQLKRLYSHVHVDVSDDEVEHVEVDDASDTDWLSDSDLEPDEMNTEDEVNRARTAEDREFRQRRRRGILANGTRDLEVYWAYELKQYYNALAKWRRSRLRATTAHSDFDRELYAAVRPPGDVLARRAPQPGLVPFFAAVRQKQVEDTLKRVELAAKNPAMVQPKSALGWSAETAVQHVIDAQVDAIVLRQFVNHRTRTSLTSASTPQPTQPLSEISEQTREGQLLAQLRALHQRESERLGTQFGPSELATQVNLDLFARAEAEEIACGIALRRELERFLFDSGCGATNGAGDLVNAWDSPATEGLEDVQAIESTFAQLLRAAWTPTTFGKPVLHSEEYDYFSANDPATDHLSGSIDATVAGRVLARRRMRTTAAVARFLTDPNCPLWQRKAAIRVQVDPTFIRPSHIAALYSAAGADTLYVLQRLEMMGVTVAHPSVLVRVVRRATLALRLRWLVRQMSHRWTVAETSLGLVSQWRLFTRASMARAGFALGIGSLQHPRSTVTSLPFRYIAQISEVLSGVVRTAHLDALTCAVGSQLSQLLYDLLSFFIAPADPMAEVPTSTSALFYPALARRDASGQTAFSTLPSSPASQIMYMPRFRLLLESLHEAQRESNLLIDDNPPKLVSAFAELTLAVVTILNALAAQSDEMIHCAVSPSLVALARMEIADDVRQASVARSAAAFSAFKALQSATPLQPMHGLVSHPVAANGSASHAVPSLSGPGQTAPSSGEVHSSKSHALTLASPSSLVEVPQPVTSVGKHAKLMWKAPSTLSQTVTTAAMKSAIADSTFRRETLTNAFRSACAASPLGTLVAARVGVDVAGLSTAERLASSAMSTGSSITATQLEMYAGPGARPLAARYLAPSLAAGDVSGAVAAAEKPLMSLAPLISILRDAVATLPGYKASVDLKAIAESYVTAITGGSDGSNKTLTGTLIKPIFVYSSEHPGTLAFKPLLSSTVLLDLAVTTRSAPVVAALIAGYAAPTPATTCAAGAEVEDVLQPHTASSGGEPTLAANAVLESTELIRQHASRLLVPSSVAAPGRTQSADEGTSSRALGEAAQFAFESVTSAPLYLSSSTAHEAEQMMVVPTEASTQGRMVNFGKQVGAPSVNPLNALAKSIAAAAPIRVAVAADASTMLHSLLHSSFLLVQALSHLQSCVSYDALTFAARRGCKLAETSLVSKAVAGGPVSLARFSSGPNVELSLPLAAMLRGERAAGPAKRKGFRSRLHSEGLSLLDNESNGGDSDNRSLGIDEAEDDIELTSARIGASLGGLAAEQVRSASLVNAAAALIPICASAVTKPELTDAALHYMPVVLRALQGSFTFADVLTRDSFKLTQGIAESINATNLSASDSQVQSALSAIISRDDMRTYEHETRAVARLHAILMACRVEVASMFPCLLSLFASTSPARGHRVVALLDLINTLVAGTSPAADAATPTANMQYQSTETATKARYDESESEHAASLARLGASSVLTEADMTTLFSHINSHSMFRAANDALGYFQALYSTFTQKSTAGPGSKNAAAYVSIVGWLKHGYGGQLGSDTVGFTFSPEDPHWKSGLTETARAAKISDSQGGASGVDASAGATIQFATSLQLPLINVQDDPRLPWLFAVNPAMGKVATFSSDGRMTADGMDNGVREGISPVSEKSTGTSGIICVTLESMAYTGENEQNPWQIAWCRVLELVILCLRRRLAHPESLLRFISLYRYRLAFALRVANLRVLTVGSLREVTTTIQLFTQFERSMPAWRLAAPGLAAVVDARLATLLRSATLILKDDALFSRLAQAVSPAEIDLAEDPLVDVAAGDEFGEGGLGRQHRSPSSGMNRSVLGGYFYRKANGNRGSAYLATPRFGTRSVLLSPPSGPDPETVSKANLARQLSNVSTKTSIVDGSVQPDGGASASTAGGDGQNMGLFAFQKSPFKSKTQASGMTKLNLPAAATSVSTSRPSTGPPAPPVLGDRSSESSADAMPGFIRTITRMISSRMPSGAVLGDADEAQLNAKGLQAFNDNASDSSSASTVSTLTQQSKTHSVVTISAGSSLSLGSVGQPTGQHLALRSIDSLLDHPDILVTRPGPSHFGSIVQAMLCGVLKASSAYLRTMIMQHKASRAALPFDLRLSPPGSAEDSVTEEAHHCAVEELLVHQVPVTLAPAFLNSGMTSQLGRTADEAFFTFLGTSSGVNSGMDVASDADSTGVQKLVQAAIQAAEPLRKSIRPAPSLSLVLELFNFCLISLIKFQSLPDTVPFSLSKFSRLDPARFTVDVTTTSGLTKALALVASRPQNSSTAGGAANTASPQVRMESPITPTRASNSNTGSSTTPSSQVSRSPASGYSSTGMNGSNRLARLALDPQSYSGLYSMAHSLLNCTDTERRHIFPSNGFTAPLAQKGMSEMWQTVSFLFEHTLFLLHVHIQHILSIDLLPVAVPKHVLSYFNELLFQQERYESHLIEKAQKLANQQQSYASPDPSHSDHGDSHGIHTRGHPSKARGQDVTPAMAASILGVDIRLPGNIVAEITSEFPLDSSQLRTGVKALEAQIRMLDSYHEAFSALRSRELKPLLSQRSKGKGFASDAFVESLIQSITSQVEEIKLRSQRLNFLRGTLVSTFSELQTVNSM